MTRLLSAFGARLLLLAARCAFTVISLIPRSTPICLFNRPATTRVNQDYLENYPDGYTCHFIRPNWVLPKREGVGRESEPVETASQSL